MAISDQHKRYTVRPYGAFGEKKFVVEGPGLGYPFDPLVLDDEEQARMVARACDIAYRVGGEAAAQRR